MKQRAPYLLLGAGKSSFSLARYLWSSSGSGCLCLTEEADGSSLLRFSPEAQSWEKIQSYPQNFDTFDWSQIEFQNLLVSPGIDCRRKFFTSELAAKEIRELDLFRSKFEGKILAITGTNGKSTATYQSGYLFRKAFGEEAVFVGGNLGTPMFDLFIEKPNVKYAVLEISSYQAERLKGISADWSLLLNLAPDHLSRYASVEEYYAAKWNLLSHSYYPYFPKECSVPKGLGLVSLCEFSVEDSLAEILLKLFLSFRNQAWVPKSFEISLEAFQNLPRLPHRLEPVFVTQEVSVVNDSKATNVSSVVYALRQRSARLPRLHLILGGVTKGDDFSVILPYLHFEDQIWIYGQDREKIRNQVGTHSGKVHVFQTLELLTDEVFSAAKKGDRILLSPGGASFDEFKNFEHRGDFFREKALRLLK